MKELHIYATVKTEANSCKGYGAGFSTLVQNEKVIDSCYRIYAYEYPYKMRQNAIIDIMNVLSKHPEITYDKIFIHTQSVGLYTNMCDKDTMIAKIAKVDKKYSMFYNRLLHILTAINKDFDFIFIPHDCDDEQVRYCLNQANIKYKIANEEYKKRNKKKIIRKT